MRITLLNDTRVESNPGCHATVSALHQLLTDGGASEIKSVALGAGHAPFARMVAAGLGRSHAQWSLAVAELQRDRSIIDSIESSELVVVNLEGTFHHHAVGALALGGMMALAHRAGKRVWAVNGTIQDIDSWLLRESLAPAAHVAVREPLSARWLRANGIRASVSADCAFRACIGGGLSERLVLPPRAALYTPGVLVRPDQDGALAHADVMTHLDAVASRGFTPVYLEVEEADGSVADAVRERGWTVIRVADVPWRQFGTFLRHFDLVISGRYHVLIFAAMAGVPCLPLRTNTWKIEGLLAHFGCEVPVSSSPADLEAALIGGRFVQPTAWMVARLRQLAGRNIAGLAVACVQRSRWSRRRALIGPSSMAPVDDAGVSPRRVIWPPASSADAASALVGIFNESRSLDRAAVAIAGLERVMPSDVPDVLIAMRRVAVPAMCVVIDSAPDGTWAGTHGTVRPIATWRRLLAVAGFGIAREEACPALSADAASPLTHWRRLRPLRDRCDQAPCAVTLVPEALPASDAHERMRTLLGLRPVGAVPSALLDGTTRVVFLIGSHQEFRQYLPLWDQLHASCVSVWIRLDEREDAGVGRRLQCVLGVLRDRGIATEVIRSVRDINWARYPESRRVLVSGADSTAYDSHLWNSAVVAAAQARGFATVQMQHGIWPYADLEREMTWLSDVVATWSDEFEQACRETVQWPDGSQSPRAVVADAAFETTGCPLFDRYAGDVDDSLELQLGAWVTHYSRRILVATNLHWTQHRAGAMVNPAILELAATRPDTLFLLKPHLVHDVDDALLAACPPNVVVLDEFCCLFAGLDSARLISASDAVISTQSTVVLEAALARVPVVTLDSGNPNRYRYVDLVEPANLPSAIDRTFRVAATDAFVDHYYDRAMLGRATANVLKLIAHRSRDVLRPAPSVRHMLALARFSEYLSVYAGDLVSLRTWTGRSAALAAAERGRVERALVEAREGRLTDLAAMEARHAELEHVQTLRDLALLTPRHGRTVRVLLFGASEAGRRALEAARRVPHLEVLAFLDNDRLRWASRVDDVPVWAPTPDCLGSADAIVITSIHTRAIAEQVAAAGHANRLVYSSTAFDQLALRSRTA